MLLLELIEIPLWVILIIFIIIALYWYGTRGHGYWAELGVPGPKTQPFIGTLGTIPYRDDFHRSDIELQKIYGKTVGLYFQRTPELMIYDEEMITEVAVKQFQKFTDKRPQAIKDKEIKSSLLNLKGETWKMVRSIMSPTFTTGKLRKMSDEINRCAKSFVERLISTDGGFEAKGLSENYTIDCIASTAFGLRVNSQKDEQNQFTVNAKRFLDFSIRGPRFLISLLGPEWFVKLLTTLGFNLNLFDKAAMEYFSDVIKKTLVGRAEGDTKRNDFLQLMVNAQKGEDIQDKDATMEDKEDKAKSGAKRGLTTDEVVANALLFFLGGFDTVSIGLTYLMYNLACHQECQQKLIDEVDSIIGDSEDIAYDMVMKMQYLDQCVNESLRIFPPVFRVDRHCTSDADICGLKIKKGVIVSIPILAIHRDPSNWPEPMKFDPERFSPERKANIKDSQYLPFGIGQRSCIAKRQALFEIKVAIAQLLRTHKLVTCDKTEIPIQLSKTKPMVPKNGAWLALKKRV